MPSFTRQVAPDGGLIVQALIGVSQARRNVLIAAGRAVPSQITVQALIDTGADCTCVDPAILAQLGVTPTGAASISTPTTGDQPATAYQYDVSFTIPFAAGQPPLEHQNIPVLETQLMPAQGFHALIGRDILGGCLLTYDGRNGLFSLAF